MHLRNRYAKQKELDLVHLSKEYPPLLDHLIQSSIVGNQNNHKLLQFDPKVPGAVDALVTALIRVDFGVASYKGVPNGNLVPSVTRSLNYIHFIEDLISEAQSKGVTLESIGKERIENDYGYDANKGSDKSTASEASILREKQTSSSDSLNNELGQDAILAEQNRSIRCSNGLVQDESGSNFIDQKESSTFNNEHEQSESGGSGQNQSVVTKSDNFAVNACQIDESNSAMASSKNMDDSTLLQASTTLNGCLEMSSQPPKRIRIDKEETDAIETTNTNETSIKIKGIDVGVGASCIFPILACAIHQNWYFIGIDVDATVLEWARANSLQFKNRIQLKLSERGPIPQIKRVLDVATDEKFDFIMCNPPFFSHPEETYRLDFNGEDFAEDDPNYEILQQERVFGGTDLERWCEGGEVGFVSGLIDESMKLRRNVVWFTSMLGMKSSLNPILAKLHQINPQTIRVHRLEQGHRARWVIAWSFEESLAISPMRGRVIHVDNLEPGETLQQRIRSALEELRGFTVETGICGGTEGFRYRIQVVKMDDQRVRVDALDLKRGKNETENDVRRRAVSTIRKVEQGLERKSRRWRKIGGAKRVNHHLHQNN